MKLTVTIGKYGEINKDFEMEGTLDSAKTYIKLINDKEFRFAAIEKLDNLAPGDVNRWIVNKNRTTGEVFLKPFSFFDQFNDPADNALLNLNAMSNAINPESRVKISLLDAMLGGGEF